MDVTGDKYYQQIQRKREYNRQYYQKKIKPRREQEKNELNQLRNKCTQLDRMEQLAEENLQLRREILVLKESLEMSRKRNLDLLSERAEDYLPDMS